ncbi:MFS transporter [Streptomyces sp. NPDC006923]|uniref:MFS transporter n=1 Tax=Streptomyces sp. NPDC006923 TaxID=3155355 RepID=UPI0033D118EF
MRADVSPRVFARPDRSGLWRRIYLPRSADAGATAMTTYGIPLLVLATTDSAALTGTAFALEWVPRLGAFTLAGAVVDRYGTTRVFRLACLARAVVVIAAALLLSAVGGNGGATVTVMVLAASTGVLSEFSYIAAETAGASASREAGDQAHRVQSALMGIDQAATLSGPALAGLLLERSGATGMLSAVAFFSLLGAGLAPRQPAVRPTAAPVPAITGLRAGWATLRSLPALGWLVMGVTLSNLSLGLLQAATPVIVVKELGHSSADVGLVWSAAAGASLLAIALCRKAIDRNGLWPVGALSGGVAACACLALSTAHHYTIYLVLTSALMVGEGGITVVLRTVRSHLIPPEAFGSTLSLTILLLLLPFPLAGVLVAITPIHLLGHAMACCAVLQAVGLTVAFTRLRAYPLRRP